MKQEQNVWKPCEICFNYDTSRIAHGEYFESQPSVEKEEP